MFPDIHRCFSITLYSTPFLFSQITAKKSNYCNAFPICSLTPICNYYGFNNPFDVELLPWVEKEDITKVISYHPE